MTNIKIKYTLIDKEGNETIKTYDIEALENGTFFNARILDRLKVKEREVVQWKKK